MTTLVKKKRECIYSDCFYYTATAKNYCCLACASDAHDKRRLEKEKKERKKS